MTYKLLIVDDETPNLRLLERLFRHDYYCLTASSGAEAIRLLDQHDVAVVITDQRMPQMTGIELLKHTAAVRPHMIRILLTGYTDVEALVEAINSGLVYMYINKPWNNDDLKMRVSRAIENYENNKRRHTLALTNQRLIEGIKELKSGFVRALTTTLRARDYYEYEHSRRVSRYANMVADRISFSEQMRSELVTAAFLHDVGKIGIPDRILLEQEPLSNDDQRTLQSHAEVGADILAGISEFRDIAEIVRLHHENYDGSGYSSGLKGDQIPPSARVLRVVDEYDLLTSSRWGTSSSHSNAINILREGAGKEFDPQVVEAFSQLAPNDLLDLHGLHGTPITVSVPSPSPAIVSESPL